MATAQLTEEELQQSAVLSDEDPEFEDAPIFPSDRLPQTTESPLTNPNTHDDELSDAVGDEDEERDASTAEDDIEMGENLDDHSELSEQDSMDDEVDHQSDEDMEQRMEQDERDDASGGARSRSSSSLLDAIEEDEAEGVGAVKFRPGETDEEADEPDSDHSDSHSESGIESEEDAAWDEVAAADEDDEEESEDAAPNMCIFCKQDEEHDPAEDFEDFLTCVNCGENSHQHCAREAGALQEQSSLSQWKCLDCALGADAPVDEAEVDTAQKQEYEYADEHDDDKKHEIDLELSPSSRRSTASQVARDLLPPQKGTIKPDSHSVFNHLLLDGDPMDGSRVLRKRKTSSVEADDIVMSLRKRRRNASKDRESSHGAGASQDGRSGTRDKDSRRKLRLNPTRKSQSVTVIRQTRSVVVKMRLKPSALRRVLSRKSASNRRRVERASTTAPPHDGLAAAMTASFTSSDYAHPFYSFFDKETDEVKAKPYGGILSEADADTSRTLPTNDDRRRFDEAKQKAEEVWRARLHSVQLNLATPAKRSKKSSGPASQIECIDFGGWEIDTWYAAPYPEEYSRNRTLYICEFCLKYMNSDYVAWRHKLKCPAKHPPGDEIYRHGSVSVFEVDGRKNPVYCQNLCLLAKLFLGSKTLYYDVEPFLFYVLCEYDALGYHFVGYFSKEKRASSQNNVSCILTLPIHQRKGYGNLLIDFSYLLTRVERKTGSPEKPLSDMGLVSYRNYWRLVLCRYLLDHVEEEKSAAPGLSIRQMSDDTGLTPDDVISALEGLRCLVRDPQTELYAFRVDLAYCNEYIAKWEAKNYVKLNPDALTWTPYVMGRGNATNFELGPAISAIAPREEDDSHKPAQETLLPSLQQQPAVNGLPTKGIVDNFHTPVDALSASADSGGKDTNGSKVEPDIYESTESHQDGLVGGDGSRETVNEDGFQHSEVPHSATPEQAMGRNWASMYKDIPPSRFEVYPLPGGRRSDRPRPSVPRPSVPRNTSNNPRPRRSGGGSSARRPTASRPKSKSSSSSARRKTGGTGRGPGRWPKGTKKSDYGNADSGPGLPPGWVKDKQRLASLGASKDQEVEGLKPESKETIDVVRVQFEDGAQEATGEKTAGGGHSSHGAADGHAER